MPVWNVSNGVPKSVKDIALDKLTDGKTYFPSPSAWEDEVLYFLMLDRFSDGREHGGFLDIDENPVSAGGERATPLFRFDTDAGNAQRLEWEAAGRGWCGGTIKGLSDKLGYLKRLGITAVWVSPVFKQVEKSQDYHGYGIQNFLDVDPNFGTRDELIQFVQDAHKAGIRVIMDIILNHGGNVFAYPGNHRYYYHDGMVFDIEGFRRDIEGPGEIQNAPDPSIEPTEAVWPVEFQHKSAWTRQGEIRSWDDYPEYMDGDFLSLKDINMGNGPKDPSYSWDIGRRAREFYPGPVLDHLISIYKYWIALADIDGYRIDTVKHMEPGAVRIFVNALHEFAQSLGKENFYCIGEVTGGRPRAVAMVNETGLDAALGIDDIQVKLEFLAKGYRNPGDPTTDAQTGYFDLFRNSLLEHKHTHQWYGKHIVTMFDDHDQVGTRHKFRFCGHGGEESYKALVPALGLNLTTLGIPCIYYGTEQAFNGSDHRKGDDNDDYSDIFLRECMFGGKFGSFQSINRHFFNEDHPVYIFVSRLCQLREKHIVLRRGRQFLREVSGSGNEGDFHYPGMMGHQLRWVIAWSRIFADKEYLCAINTDQNKSLTVWVTVDYKLHPPESTMNQIFTSTNDLFAPDVKVENRNGSAIEITVPPAGFAVYH